MAALPAPPRGESASRGAIRRRRLQRCYNITYMRAAMRTCLPLEFATGSTGSACSFRGCARCIACSALVLVSVLGPRRRAAARAGDPPRSAWRWRSLVGVRHARARRAAPRPARRRCVVGAGGHRADGGGAGGRPRPERSRADDRRRRAGRRRAYPELAPRRLSAICAHAHVRANSSLTVNGEPRRIAAGATHRRSRPRARAQARRRSRSSAMARSCRARRWPMSRSATATCWKSSISSAAAIMRRRHLDRRRPHLPLAADRRHRQVQGLRAERRRGRGVGRGDRHRRGAPGERQPIPRRRC